MLHDDFDALLSGASEPANLSVALDLARRDFAVFPIRDWRDGDGWKPIKRFQEKASADVTAVRDWWQTWPDARVGLLAGERNGITVLHIDVKNGKDGTVALASLGFSEIAGLSPVRVRTPSGGWHLFFRYDARLRNSVSKIGPGIDVKTEGGFVVAPGSFKDSGCYAVDGAALGSVKLPGFPESLIPPPDEHVAVEPLSDATDDQRQWAAAKLRERAAKLATQAEGGRNAALNHAAMWAGGAAAHGFLPEDGARAALWAAAKKSGMRDREFRSTFESGWKAGLRRPICDFPAGISADDFDDLDGGADEFSALATLGDNDGVTARLNLRHAVVVVRGRTLITTEHGDGSIDFGTVRDLHSYYENDRVAGGDGKTEAASRRWLRNPDRRSCPNGVIFAPGGCSDGALNLWRGWAVEPDPAGSCELLLQHVRNVICLGNAEHAAYVIGWLAHMVQRPEEKPGVGVVLRGSKGAGKDTLADYVARMIGRRHVPTVAESDHIVGKFNARLETALLRHVQEGSWAGDRKAESVLKYLVTSERVEIERKGIDSINLPSVLRLFISANAEWVVPASPDERRWAVFDVSAERKGDAAYFKALRAEMNGRGPAALLHYLKTVDLASFDVRQAPDTKGLSLQKVASLRNVELWWFEMLNRGVPPIGFDAPDDWASSTSIGRDALRGHYLQWVKGQRFENAANDIQFGHRLRAMLPEIEDSRPRLNGARVRQYTFPALSGCRASFERFIGGAIDWEQAR